MNNLQNLRKIIGSIQEILYKSVKNVGEDLNEQVKMAQVKIAQNVNFKNAYLNITFVILSLKYSIYGQYAIFTCAIFLCSGGGGGANTVVHIFII